jgi:hypothetical protein
MQTYNLQYIQGGRVIQTLETNKPKPICLAAKRRLEKDQNYKLGKLIVIANI